MYGVYPKEVADAIYDFYKGQRGEVPDLPSDPSLQRVTWYFVKLTEDLNAATDPETGQTQATAVVIRYIRDGSLDMEEATGEGTEITVTNRSTSFSAAIDDYFWVVRPYGVSEFIPLIATGGSVYFWFTVNSLVCPGEDPTNFPDGGLIVTATYSETGNFPRGRNDDGTYYVYDYMGILDYSIDAVDNINGSKGRCSWGAEIGTTNFHWILDSIMVNPSCA